MTTRIKYHKTSSGLTSNYLTNYEGKRFIVFIHTISKSHYRTVILDEKHDAVEVQLTETLELAKRNARWILMNKYNVRLNEEIRQGG